MKVYTYISFDFLFIIIYWQIKWHNFGFVSEGGKFLFLICMFQTEQGQMVQFWGLLVELHVRSKRLWCDYYFLFSDYPHYQLQQCFLPSHKFWQSSSRATKAQSWHQDRTFRVRYTMFCVWEALERFSFLWKSTLAHDLVIWVFWEKLIFLFFAIVRY